MSVKVLLKEEEEEKIKNMLLQALCEYFLPVKLAIIFSKVSNSEGREGGECVGWGWYCIQGAIQES